MAEIVLSQAGAVIGAAALPGGVNIAGLQLSGAAIGSTLGGLAGRSIDSALAPAIEGPRIAGFHAMESREGAGIAKVYGRMRVGGQLIWASRFRERRREQSTGKTGPRIANYTYSISLAVAIAEGPVTRLDRVWANGETLALADYNWRFYDGREDQEPDPLIEAIEGAGEAPAFRGTAYIVFEDFPLDAFGNRLPQLSFEVVRAGDAESGLRQQAKSVNIIPASGEFVYGTRIVRERYFPGIERALNMNNAFGDADFSRSLDQLTSDLPNVTSANLTIAWFGDDLRTGDCRIRPGIETRERNTVPYQWQVAGQSREAAYQVSQTSGAANYGGTPADQAVLEGIAALKAEGLAVTLLPFLLMDVPPGNGLPDPYGAAEQPAFPWRGRMTVAADGTAEVRTQIEAFLGSDNDFGYRHFILHHARLAAEAGGIDAILIGSEMRGLTRLRDETGAFPFVDGLVQLAADVKAIVGSGVKVSYAADWTEYGAYVPADGSGDVLFPLDPLWASTDVDFVGVDWYPPIGDWRDGTNHLDRLAGYRAADDPAYLDAQMAGGEAFDWYYASQADRDAQVRTPITDTAHGEDWIFRKKDLAGWWANAHFERPGGTRSASPTGWTPGLKPVRLVEIGFPAVDKGGNAPNLFHDPKSSESALPPYSSGARDDVFQRRALEAALGYWQDQACVEQASIWAWDARPWPDFPVRETVWSDGPNWALGHWLNGRTGLITLAEAVEHLFDGAGLSIDVTKLDGLVEGYLISDPTPLRRALEPLRAAYGLGLLERETGFAGFTGTGDGAVEMDPDRLAAPGLAWTRPLLDKRPGRLRLSYINADGGYAPATSNARRQDGDTRYSIAARIPLVLSEAVARDLADHLLAAISEPDTVEFSLPPEYAGLEPGDMVSLAGYVSGWQAGEISDRGLMRTVTASRPVESLSSRSGSLPAPSGQPFVEAAPELVLIDAPSSAQVTPDGPLAAASADPWPGALRLLAGASAAAFTERAVMPVSAAIGRLVAPLETGPSARWDRANVITLELRNADMMTAAPGDVLAGANRILVQAGDNWELIGFEAAELVADSVWQLHGLLRGLNGTPVLSAQQGATCVIDDGRLVTAGLTPSETGRSLLWQAGTAEPMAFAHTGKAGLPWPVAHLAARTSEEGIHLTWLACGPDIPDGWERPDPVRSRQYRVEGLADGVIIHSETVSGGQALIPAGCDLARVAEIGTDGRSGRRVSIGTGAS